MLCGMTGHDVWREVTATNLYDTDLIQARLEELRRLRHNADEPHALMFALRAGLIRNYAGIGHKKLYFISHVGTKRLIEVVVHASDRAGLVLIAAVSRAGLL